MHGSSWRSAQQSVPAEIWTESRIVVMITGADSSCPVLSDAAMSVSRFPLNTHDSTLCLASGVEAKFAAHAKVDAVNALNMSLDGRRVELWLMI